MCSELKYILAISLLLASCTQYRVIHKVRSGEISMGIGVPHETPVNDTERESVTDSISCDVSDGPVIMNAIRDDETGEMVATDIIDASRVTARFRNVPERGGYVTVGFDVHVPSALARSAWKLEMLPELVLQDDTLALEPLYITGKAYRETQLRGYERYRRFLESIISDPDCFIRVGQLEIFLQRYFPETYAMKTDSSYVSDPMAENLFGVTQKDALMHYRKKWREESNERRKGRKDRMYAKYVKDPMKSDGVRLDTVVASGNDFTYVYTHRFKSRPGLRKAVIYIEGQLLEKGEKIMDMPESDDITYYISSLSTLVDPTPRYRTVILERTVYDNTKVLLDFAQGSSEIDTLLGDNASELMRVGRCIADVSSKEEFVLDSLIISAACSPEGRYSYNAGLASRRAESVRNYISAMVPPQWKEHMKVRSVPENWDHFRLLVNNDSIIDRRAVKRIMELSEDMDDPDMVENRIAQMPQYRYLREKIYPRLRSVKFDFYLHRSGMVKDTVHTTEPDTLYMSGVEALRNLDYKRAVSLLRSYGDYNSALAFMSAEYNHSALDVLQRLDCTDAKVCYLTAMVLSRLGQKKTAGMYFNKALQYDPYLRHRANLDPEMSGFVSELDSEY